MTPKGWEGGRLCAKVRHLPLEGFPSQKGAGSRGTQPSPAEKLHRGAMARSGSVAPSRGTSPGQATLHSSCRAGRATKYQLGSGRHIQTISSPSQTRGWAPQKGSARAAWCWCPPSPGTQPGADTTFEPQDQKPTRVWGSAAHLQLLPWPHTGPPHAGPSPPSPANCFGHGVLAPPHPHVQPNRSVLQLSARGDARGCQHGLTEGMSSGKNLHLKCS